MLTGLKLAFSFKSVSYSFLKCYLRLHINNPSSLTQIYFSFSKKTLKKDVLISFSELIFSKYFSSWPLLLTEFNIFLSANQQNFHSHWMYILARKASIFHLLQFDHFHLAEWNATVNLQLYKLFSIEYKFFLFSSSSSFKLASCINLQQIFINDISWWNPSSFKWIYLSSGGLSFLIFDAWQCNG